MNPLMKLYDDNRRAPARLFEVRAVSKTEAEVMLYDVIGGFYGIDAGKFTKDLKAIKADTIHLRINSPGGEVTAAKAMQTALSQHPARVVAHVDGVAASAATVVMVAADEIVASEGAFVMVHNPWALTIGDADDHRKNAELLDKFTDALAADYQKRTGKDAETVRGWMTAETWFTAAEAVDAGLVDRVDETVVAKSEWDLSAYANAPAELAVAAMVRPEPGATAAQNDVAGAAPGTTKQKEVQTMDNPTTQGQPNAPNPETIRAEALKAERERVAQITALADKHQMGAEFVTAAITAGTGVDEIRVRILETLAERGNEVNTRGATSAAVTHDAVEKRRDMATLALLNRIDSAKYAVDGQNEFRAMSSIRMAEECLTRVGQSVRGKTQNELAIMAMQQTSDFPYILENVARKRLMDAYMYAEPSYRRWTRKSTSPDFKAISRPRLSEAPHMLGVPDGAQITIAQMSETRETYTLANYGRGVSFTRQMLINDDLGAFNDLVGAFGRQAAALENKIVYAILHANAAMADSVALFHNDHGNLGAGALATAAFDDMYGKMAVQRGIDARTILNIIPAFVIVPAAKLGAAQAALVATNASVKGSDQNRWAGRLEVVSDGELDTNGSGTTIWFAAANPTTHPGIEYAHLEGAEGPQMLREENTQGILGVTMYAWLDFAAKAIDWRPLYKSTGS